MNTEFAKRSERIFVRLTDIYRKFSCARRTDHTSQMCFFWADPTVEILLGSDELNTLESEFGIAFDDETALELYDMTLGEAAHLIGKLVEEQNAGNYNPNDFINNLSPDRAKDILKYLWKYHENVRSAIMFAKEDIEYEKDHQ